MKFHYARFVNKFSAVVLLRAPFKTKKTSRGKPQNRYQTGSVSVSFIVKWKCGISYITLQTQQLHHKFTNTQQPDDTQGVIIHHTHIILLLK